jgi:hypothetical protein
MDKRCCSGISLGHCSLAILFCDQYIYSNLDVLFLLFLFNRWLELVELIKIVCLSNEVRSFYGIVNNGGTVPVHTPVVWKLHIPPRIHIFLCFLMNDKRLTRENLCKRRNAYDASY